MVEKVSRQERRRRERKLKKIETKYGTSWICPFDRLTCERPPSEIDGSKQCDGGTFFWFSGDEVLETPMGQSCPRFKLGG